MNTLPFPVSEAARRRKKPHIEKVGSVSVPVYKTKWYDKTRRRNYVKHAIVWADAEGPHREQYASFERAKFRANEIANSIASGEVSMEQFRQADRAEWELVRRTAAPIGKAIPLIIADAVKAYGICPDVSLEQMAQAYRDLHPVGESDKTVSEILTEMITARIQDGNSRNTIDDYRSRLTRFGKDFTCPIRAITAADINSWLRKLPVSGRTRNNYRGNLCDIYRYATEQGYVRKDRNPMAEVPVVKNPPVRIDVFNPDEVRRLLIARQNFEIEALGNKRPVKTIMPYLAIAFFAGCRNEELCPGKTNSGKRLPGLDWSDIDFDAREIHVRKEVARKIGRDRIVPLGDGLAAWLKPYAKESGPVCQVANVVNELMDTAALAKVSWKDNGPRKTYISSRLAITQNINKVAEEAGTSPERILHNYKKTVKKTQAQSHFDIHPLQADVLQLPLAL